MPKMRIFWKKCKNRLSVGRSAPEPLIAHVAWDFRRYTPAMLLPPAIIT